ncbi:MAG TPA: DUF1080 domain-containing protein [Candidatus Limnocylindrales bacterium]|nr:DUF1080 domain-containing protein [Candidatus Limnocylindrales bacterium]
MDQQVQHRAGLGLAAVLLIAAAACDGLGGTPNPGSSPKHSASPESPAGPWIELFDGRRTTGLRGYGQEEFPFGRWIVRDGRLWTVPGLGIDLITTEAFTDFELEFTWAVTEGGNGGVIYRVIESDQPAWTTGPEYQILDDIGHPDGADPTTSAAAAYDLIAPQATKVLAPVGEDNEGRVVVQGRSVEHWLNGDVVVAYEWGADELRPLIASSKFREFGDFMAADSGKIAFQHHGEEISFGVVRIRRL